jgi:predicted transposase YbfD/YdcC
MWIDALRDVPDQRGRKGRQIALPAILSLPIAAMPAARLLDLARARWAIENTLHWRLAVSMNEDRCRVGAGAPALAHLRNLALALIR